ncbi:MAG: NAD(P)H-quinone oxidoreductase subunit F, partial [Cyanobacteriota bacterium]|nr:NAD(P)H-quinone oxidoreductase subunit F [Cyanobacteriota bacterium]
FWCFTPLVQSFLASQPLLAVVVLVTNGLTAVNLVRVYRQVFLDQPHPKTRRTPEVNWLMALPMVSLTVVVLLIPAVFARLALLPGLAAMDPLAAGLVLASGAIGAAIGVALPLQRFSARSAQPTLRWFQDLLANDFYTAQLYRNTIVAFVAGLAGTVERFDQVVVSGLARRLGTASLASAESLRFGVSGQLQSYVLTAVVALVLLLSGLVWIHG